MTEEPLYLGKLNVVKKKFPYLYLMRHRCSLFSLLNPSLLCWKSDLAMEKGIDCFNNHTCQHLSCTNLDKHHLQKVDGYHCTKCDDCTTSSCYTTSAEFDYIQARSDPHTLKGKVSNYSILVIPKY